MFFRYLPYLDVIFRYVPNFVVFFRLLDRKFNENFKNVLKTVIFLVQVGFIGDFVSVLSNCVSGSSNFDTAFLPDCTKFCRFFSVIE